MQNMNKDFKEYRNVFLKLKKKFEKLGDYGNFHLSVDNIAKTVSTKSSTDSKEFAQYLSVLNVFYKENSRINYESILLLIEKNYTNIIDAKLIEDIKSEILSNNSFKTLKPTDNLVSKEFFSEALIAYCHDSVTKFSDLHAKYITKPIIGQLLWYEFYTFCIGLYFVLQNIFQLIIQIEKNSESNLDTLEPMCIICRNNKGTFSSIEHIFPEALGNTELILEKGLVCDNCNSTLLSQLDDNLINFSPVAFLRVQFVPFTKEGKHPFANFQNMDIKKTRANRIDIRAKDKSAKFGKEQIKDDLYKFNFSFTGGHFDDKKLIRSLMKIAYEAIVREKGREFIFHNRYDSARNLILGDIEPYNNLIMSANIKPNNRLQYNINFGEIGTVILISILGLIFIFNLEEEPKLELSNEMKDDGFQIFAF